METNALHARDKHFRAGDERVENACSNFSHTHTASYQQLPTGLKCRDDCYSEYVTPTSYTYAMVFSAALNGLQVD